MLWESKMECGYVTDILTIHFNCSSLKGNEPALTTLTKNTRECLDYVFYSSTSLEAVGVLQVPGKQSVLDCKFIPNRIFPSDHLSLKAVLAFK